MRSYGVSGVVNSTGVPTSTVRYYERAGLLTPAGRTVGNYRAYGPDATAGALPMASA